MDAPDTHDVPDGPDHRQVPGADVAGGPGIAGGPVADERLLEDYAALNDPATRRRVERQGSFFVVEGAFALDALLGSRYPVRSVLASPPKAAEVRRMLSAHGRDAAPVVVRPEAEMRAVTGFAFHRGVLAAADRLPLPPVADVVRDARRLLVVEGVGDHENLGALFRNAAAFGVDAVVLDPTTADPLYRRSVRVSVGHVLRVAWARAPTWPGPLDDLRRAGVALAALTPSPGGNGDGEGDGMTIDELAAHPPDRLAFLVGAEGPGLSRPALAAADHRVRIPLAPGVDSLNVATAAAIALHRLHLPPPP